MATASVIKESGTKPQAPLAVHRFTVEQYHRMIKSGFLTENGEAPLPMLRFHGKWQTEKYRRFCAVRERLRPMPGVAAGIDSVS